MVVKNRVVRSVILPYPTRTNVQVEGNQLCDLVADEDAELVPMPTRAGGVDADDELDRRE